MSNQRVRLLGERVLRIKEESKHNMDKSEGRDFEVRLKALEAKYVEIAEKMDETDIDDLDERVDDLGAKHEEIVENMDEFESQATDVESQVSSLDEQAHDLQGARSPRKRAR